jgi:hypothetical protein
VYRREPLPPLQDDIAAYQPRFTHPLLDVGKGFANRPGFYAKLAWQPPIPIMTEAFYYDNRANPEVKNDDSEWGWRTRFANFGMLADLGGGTKLRAQALKGRTEMAYVDNGRRSFDNRFRAAYALLSHDFGTVTLAARGDLFGTRNRGSVFGDEYDEKGWSGMLAVRRDWQHLSGFAELLHVSSRMEDRQEFGLAQRSRQTQFQLVMRARW